MRLRAQRPGRSARLIAGLVLVVACTDRDEAACAPTVAVAVDAALRQYDVAILDRDGDRHLITSDQRTFGPRVSPDGLLIAATRGGAGSFEDCCGYRDLSVVVLDRSGATVAEAPGKQGFDDHSPFWSPDGKQIVFARHSADTPLTAEVLTWTLESGEVEPLAADASRFSPSPAWSPNGRHITYMTGENLATRLVVRDAETGDVTADHAFGPEGLLFWSPDGEEIIVSRAGYESPADVSIVTVSSGRIRRFVNNTRLSSVTNTSFVDGSTLVGLHYETADNGGPTSQHLETFDSRGRSTGRLRLRLTQQLATGLSFSSCSPIAAWTQSR